MQAGGALLEAKVVGTGIENIGPDVIERDRVRAFFVARRNHVFQRTEGDEDKNDENRLVFAKMARTEYRVFSF
jgi:hypothetical protein